MLNEWPTTLSADRRRKNLVPTVSQHVSYSSTVAYKSLAKPQDHHDDDDDIKEEEEEATNYHYCTNVWSFRAVSIIQ